MNVLKGNSNEDGASLSQSFVIIDRFTLGSDILRRGILSLFDIANRRSFFSTGSPSPSSSNSFCCCGCFSRCFCHKNEGRKENRIEVSNTTDKVRSTSSLYFYFSYNITSCCVTMTKSGDVYY